MTEANLRDQLTERFENLNLSQGNHLWYDAAGLNIGFGYNLTAQIGSTLGATGATARAALEAVGITFTNNQWISIVAAAQHPAATSGQATALNNSLGNAATITQSQADALMDNFYSNNVVPNLSQSLSALGLDLLSLPTGVSTGLQDLLYNAPSAITAIPGLASALQSENWGAAAYAIEFNPSISDTDTGRIRRRIAEAMYVLGFQPTFDAANNVASLEPLSADSVSTQALIGYEQAIAANDQTADFTKLPATIKNAIQGYLEDQGYYIVQPGDGSTAAAIAATLIGPGGILAASGISAQQLQNINAPFSDASFTTGGLIHVPVAGGPLAVLVPNAHQVEVFDPTTSAAYIVGASTNGQYTGQLFIDTPIGDPTYATFAAGTYSGVGEQDGNVVVQTALGALVFDPTTDSGTLTLGPDSGSLVGVTGLQYSVGNGTAFDLTAVTGTPLQQELGLLAEFGINESASQLQTDNTNFYNPAPTDGSVLTGIVQKLTDTTANVIFSGADGSTVTGQDTATITDFDDGVPFEFEVQNPNNILIAGADISHDTISNVQELDAGGTTMTAAELGEFSDVKGGGTIYVVGGGTFDLTGSNIDATADFNGLVAVDWTGTTLIGNATESQTLTASLFGNDTLVAGSGSFDTLDADDTGGNNTLTGSDTSGITLDARDSFGNNGLTAGNGNGDILNADGSSGDNVLIVNDTGGNPPPLPNESDVGFNYNNILTAEESTGDNSLTAGDGNQDLLSVAGSDGNNSLAAGNGQFDYLNASDTSGTDTLSTGTGNGNMLDVSGSDGDDILISHDVAGGNVPVLPAGIVRPFGGGNNILDASDSSGNNTMTSGDANGDALEAGGSYGDNSLTSGDGNQDFLSAGESDGDNSLTAGNGQFDYVDASGSFGDNTLSTGTGNGDTLDVGNSSGDNILISHDTGGGVPTLSGGISRPLLITGNNILYAEESSGDNTLTSGDADDDVLDVAFSSGNNILQSGNGAGDVLNANGATGDNKLTAGNGAGDVLNAGTGDDTLIGGSGGDTFNLGTGVDTVTGGTGNDTFIAAFGGLAAGTTITGGSGNDVLQVSGDISQATISGVQTLQTSFAALTADQLNSFTNIEGQFGFAATISLVAGGTYSLEGKFTNAIDMVAQSNDGTTLIGNDADGETLNASATGTDTLQAGNGNGDFLYAGGGVDTLIGGSGSDTFVLGNTLAGTTIVNGTGINTLEADGDITQATFSGITALTVSSATMTLAQFSGFTSVQSEYDGFPSFPGFPPPPVASITTADAGTWSLEGVSTDAINLIAGTSGGTTLIGNDADGETLTASATGNDTLQAGNGNGDFLYAGGGVDTLIGGNGADTFVLDNAGGNTVDIMGAGGDTVNDTSTTGDTVNVSGNGMWGTGDTVNLSSGTVVFQDNASGDVNGNSNTVTVGADDGMGVYGSNNTITAGSGSDVFVGGTGGNTVSAADGDGVNVSGNGMSGTGDTVNLSSGVVVLQNDASASIAGTGNTITAAQNDAVTITSGSNTLIAGTGGDVFTNSGGSSNTYEFGAGFGQDTINNATSASTAANGTVAFQSGINDQNLWFQQSGNNLEIDLLGTNSQITVNNWFGSDASAQVAEIEAGGLNLDSQLSQLVSAMATYAANNAGFNPTTATAMPTDATLQNTIAAAWHS
jgi:Ca2+-binding RTX toxin-like protein